MRDKKLIVPFRRFILKVVGFNQTSIKNVSRPSIGVPSLIAKHIIVSPFGICNIGCIKPL